MIEYDFSSILLPTCYYRITKRLHQHWHAASFSYISHARPDYGFLLVTKGHIRFTSSSVHLTADSGDLIFLPKGIHYEASIPPEFGPTEDYLINFDADITFPSNFPSTPIKLLHTQTHDLMESFDKLIPGDAPDSEFHIMGRFCLLLDTLLREMNADTQKKQYLAKAQELLSERDDLSVKEIAEICGISQSGLRNSFNKAYSLSPQQYRMNIKLAKAKYLLEATDLSVYAIAEQLGFYDEAYFCKMFRKYAGCSPRKYATNKSI